MRVIARNTLVAFWSAHPETKTALERWLKRVKAARWASTNEVQRAAPKCKALNGERVRFEVAGGNYRLVVAFDFPRQAAFIKFIGRVRPHRRADHIAVLGVCSMDVRPIRTEEDHQAALQEIEACWNTVEGTEEGDRLDVLLALVDVYEEKHWPIDIDHNFDPVDVLNHAIEEMGHTQAELAELLGSRSRASEILSRRRALTVEMIHKISKAWKISADLLVRPYRIDRAAERANG
jgi:HTH-type transcriptional regulator / antitoxin HigA